MKDFLKNKRILVITLSVILAFIVGVLSQNSNSPELNDAETKLSENISEFLNEEFYLTENNSVDENDSETDKNLSDNLSSTTTTQESAENNMATTEQLNSSSSKFNFSNIPAFSGNPYVVVNNNDPYFTKSDYATKSYEKYSSLDSLGRCGVAMACIGKDIMPTEDRGSIGQVKPSGWQTVKYDCVDGKYLYNRCHLIGYQLTGENANTKNLITGTRYMNVDGMLPFENMVDDYIEETNNHVLYRVTPVFIGDELVARGVLMEAYSIEDNGDGICFNVFCYNNQPGIEIDYKTGKSWLSNSSQNQTETTTKKTETTTQKTENTDTTYILNTNSKKFHYPTCSSAKKISDKNYAESNNTRDKLVNDGYSPCGICKP